MERAALDHPVLRWKRRTVPHGRTQVGVDVALYSLQPQLQINAVVSSFGSTEFVLRSEIMRVRILKPSAGIMDGVSLSHLLPGLTYDVEPSLGHYLTLNQYAEEVPSETLALVIPLDDPR